MKELFLHYGKVENINDDKKLGRIQVRVLPEMKDIKKDLLPWFLPFITSGYSSDTQSLKIPNEGDSIYVYIDKDYRVFYYLHGAFIEGLFKYDDIKSSLGGVNELSDKEYPNINFELMTDGTITFHNRVSGDHGILHNTGTYVIIDTNGYVIISESNGNKFTIDNNGIKIEDSNGNSNTMSSTGISIEDSNGNGIEMSTAGIQLKTGDSSTWMPSILPNCLFTGAPHGGSGGGIVKLKGG